MGVLGFDIGATVALLVATERTMGAAVSVADEASVSAVRDRLPSMADAMVGLTCPWLGLYGREDDGDGDADAAELRDASIKAEAVTNVVVYPRSGHRFDADPATADRTAARAELVRRPPAVTLTAGGCGATRCNLYPCDAGGRQAPGGFA